MKLNTLTIAELRRLLDNREIKPQDILDDTYARIDAVEERVKSFITVTKDEAYRMAKKAEEAILSNKAQLLTGIPIAIKDNMCTRGIETTCASKILKGFIPVYESTATTLLNSHHYSLVGKTNLDEFAMGSSTENSGFHTTGNEGHFQMALT